MCIPTPKHSVGIGSSVCWAQWISSHSSETLWRGAKGRGCLGAVFFTSFYIKSLQYWAWFQSHFKGRVEGKKKKKNRKSCSLKLLIKLPSDASTSARKIGVSAVPPLLPSALPVGELPVLHMYWLSPLLPWLTKKPFPEITLTSTRKDRGKGKWGGGSLPTADSTLRQLIFSLSPWEAG